MSMETYRQVKWWRRWGAGLVGAAVLLAGGVTLLSLPPDESAPPPAPGPVGRAMTAVGAGAPASAADLAALIGDRTAWLGRHPGDEHSWAVLGSAYVERGLRVADPGDFAPAERALRRSLALRPNGGEAATGLAALAHARGDYRGARKWGEAVRKKAPERWTAYPVLVDTYIRLGDRKAAGRALEKLEALHSGPVVGRLAAEVYRDRGWREDAAATLSDATALAASVIERAAGLRRMGDLAWERGEPRVALGHYDASLHADPASGGAHAGRGRALAALGRTGEAGRAYRGALAVAPAPEVALEYGEFLESLGRESGAREQYALVRARLALRHWRGGGELVLGRLDADHGDPEAAVRRLRAEWKRHPNAAVADGLAWALFRAGAPREALKRARWATDQGVRSALFLYHLGAIERELGEYGAARRHLDEALRVNPAFSPLLAPRAREALAALGDPAAGGPEQIR